MGIKGHCSLAMALGHCLCASAGSTRGQAALAGCRLSRGLWASAGSTCSQAVRVGCRLSQGLGVPDAEADLLRLSRRLVVQR